MIERLEMIKKLKIWFPAEIRSLAFLLNCKIVSIGNKNAMQLAEVANGEFFFRISE